MKFSWKLGGEEPVGDLWLSDPAGVVGSQRVEIAQALRQIFQLESLEAAYIYVKDLRDKGAAKLPEGLTETQIAALEGLGLHIVDSDDIRAQEDAEADMLDAQEGAGRVEDIFRLSMIALSATNGNPQEAVILLARLAELDMMPDEEIMAAATIIGRTF